MNPLPANYNGLWQIRQRRMTTCHIMQSTLPFYYLPTRSYSKICTSHIPKMQELKDIIVQATAQALELEPLAPTQQQACQPPRR